MSGGHFDYIQYRIFDVVEQVENAIERYVDCEDDWCNVSKETIDKMLETHKTLWLAYTMLHRLDWFVSGDDGEETYHERLERDLKEALDDIEEYRYSVVSKLEKKTK
jgi:hypothetical protein